MARGSKPKYTARQRRKARHIEEGDESRGVARPEAARRAWATVNKTEGGGKRSGSGRRRPGRAPKKRTHHRTGRRAHSRSTPPS